MFHPCFRGKETIRNYVSEDELSPSCAILELLVVALATDGQTGCLFDGRVYAKGETIIIKDCLGSMVCLGNNNYGGLQTIGDVCPNKRNTEGQTGCLFDGKVYLKNEKIMIGHCLAEMTCLGNNLYSDAVALGGVCPNKRSADGQIGCLFDGHVYQKGENIIIGHCLAEMTCLGNNLYSDPIPLGGQCPDKTQRRAVDGQSGCLFDGKVYAPRDEIIFPNCLGKMTCLGQNNYSPITLMNGICENKRSTDGQTGCLFDGHVYTKGDTINIGDCLGRMTCLGQNLYSNVEVLGGQC